MADADTPCVLVLAGLDPSGGAGLLADAEVIRAAGARPLCVATALTAQTTRRMHGFQPLAPALALQTAQALLEEEPVRAIKVGMLGTAAMARAVADLLARAALPAVVDPVLSATSGAALFQGGPEAARAAYSALWAHGPRSGRGRHDLHQDPRDADALERAARELVRRGAKAALVKGGHAGGAEAVDVLCTANGCERLSAARIGGSGARGTGCRLASALAAGLARGRSLPDAARGAKEFVTGYLRATAEER